MSRVVLVTGVAGELGRRFARRLAEHPEVDRVVGVDIVPPKADIGAIQFVRADIRNPVIGKILTREQVDTVVHVSVASDAGGGRGRSDAKELNVIGTMQLLAACQQAPEVRHLVVKSSSAVYGATSRDPAMFTEEMSAKRIPGGGFAKDVVDVESYVRGFARRRPDVRVATLRMANVVGPLINSPLTAYFRLPLVPTILGYDARLQFVHEHDAHGSLERAVLSDAAGTFNVCGDGVMMLSQALRRLGRPTLPLPPFAVSGLGGVVRQIRMAHLTAEQVAFLTYGRGMDNTRMRTELGYEPVYTTEQTFDAFAEGAGPGVFRAERVRAVEGALLGALGGEQGAARSRRLPTLSGPSGRSAVAEEGIDHG